MKPDSKKDLWHLKDKIDQPHACVYGPPEWYDREIPDVYGPIWPDNDPNLEKEENTKKEHRGFFARFFGKNRKK